MKVLFIAVEASPLVKAGELADVIGSLPKALITPGHEVHLILPRYGSLDADIQDAVPEAFPVEVSLMGCSKLATLKMTTLEGEITVYLVENDHYLGSPEVYTADDIERFLFFSLAIPDILSQLDWLPDVIHFHDWHTSLIPLWLNEDVYHKAMRLPCFAGNDG